jgi:hypothetical protein
METVKISILKEVCAEKGGDENKNQMSQTESKQQGGRFKPKHTSEHTTPMWSKYSSKKGREDQIA